jgi:hypothetical protein
MSPLGQELPVPASADSASPQLFNQNKGESNQLKLKGNTAKPQANSIKGEINQIKPQSNQYKEQTTGAGAGKKALNPQPLPPG